MRFDIHLEREHSPTCADYRVEVKQRDTRIAAFYAQRVDPSKGYLSLLQQIAAAAPNSCNDFAVTHARWHREGSPHNRRMSEWKAYCPHHLGVGFPAYHVAYDGEERVFECTYCGCTFPESRGQECDDR